MIEHESIVFIVDDNLAVRDSLTLMLKQENFNVQSFENAETFLNAYQPGYSGCIILDVHMPDMDGPELQQELSRRKIKLPVIFLTGHGSIPMSVRAIKAGAVDFLTKPVMREKLMTCVRSAFVEGDKKIKEDARNHAAISRFSKLTKREREVMTLAVEGYSNKEIASHLNISHRTVEIHKSRIMDKTGAINLLDLAHIAHEANLSE